MSRSRRKTPVTGVTTAISEKEDKRIYNRAMRRKNRQALSRMDEEPIFVEKREVMSVWVMDKDGKMRFDPVKCRELMRK